MISVQVEVGTAELVLKLVRRRTTCCCRNLYFILPNTITALFNFVSIVFY